MLSKQPTNRQQGSGLRLGLLLCVPLLVLSFWLLALTYFWVAGIGVAVTVVTLLLAWRQLSGQAASPGAPPTGTGDDPFERVGTAFDRMAESLERRVVDRRVINQRLFDAQRIARLGNWEFDLASGSWWLSPDAYAIFSMNPAERSFDAFLAWVHVDDRAQVAAMLGGPFHGACPFDLEFRAIDAHGCVRWIHAAGECAFAEAGELVRRTGVLQDITERKEVELKLRLYENAIARANDIVVIAEAGIGDSPAHIVFVNRMFESFTGLSADEVRGTNPRNLPLVNADPEWQGRIRAALVAGKPIRTEIAGVTREKAPCWMEIDLSPILCSDGRLTHWIAIARDISERRQTAAALAASEERYRQLFQDTPLPIAIQDPDSLRYTAVNDAFCRQVGYSEAELKSQPALELIPPALRETVAKQIRALPKGLTTAKDLQKIRKDGSVIDVEVTRNRTDVGGREMVIVSPIDMTARNQAESALKASEERYRILFENNPLPLWVFDTDTLRFLDANEIACHQLGYSRAALLAMTILDVHAPEEIPRLKEFLESETHTTSVSGPWRHRRRDGGTIQVELTMHMATLNGRPARFASPIDVTERIFAQEEIQRMNVLLERKVELRTGELSRSLALQQSIFDNVPQIVWLADLKGSVSFVNRIWAEKIGVTADDWRGASWVRALHPDDADRVAREWQEAVATKELFEIEYRFLHRDGSYHDYQVNACKVYATGSEPLCWVGICTDVTDSRRREEALQFANRELEAFSYSVSHDLRAPLRAIAGFSERLQAEATERLDEPSRHYLERILAGAANMSLLIDDLLNLSRLTRAEMVMGSVNLSKLARQVFDELCQQQTDRAVSIDIRDGMVAIGDPGLLRVVLVNLIGNALKFTAKRADAKIEIGEEVLPGGMSTYFVRDNGAGFDPAYASKLFGVFQRLHSTKEFPGTGIGLATVQRIVQRHGGRVSAAGAIDQGATFSFSLQRG